MAKSFWGMSCEWLALKWFSILRTEENWLLTDEWWKLGIMSGRRKRDVDGHETFWHLQLAHLRMEFFTWPFTLRNVLMAGHLKVHQSGEKFNLRNIGALFNCFLVKNQLTLLKLCQLLKITRGRATQFGVNKKVLVPVFVFAVCHSLFSWKLDSILCRCQPKQINFLFDGNHRKMCVVARSTHLAAVFIPVFPTKIKGICLDSGESGGQRCLLWQPAGVPLP